MSHHPWLTFLKVRFISDSLHSKRGSSRLDLASGEILVPESFGAERIERAGGVFEGAHVGLFYTVST